MFLKLFTVLLVVLVLNYKQINGQEICKMDDCQCKNGSGECMSFKYQCDSAIDCSDESDEEDCETCEMNEFTCKDGECISLGYRCDGYNECSDGSDEENCRNFTCSLEHDTCESGLCYIKSGRCNGRINCRDKSDEFNCSECSVKEAFTCNGGGCILKEWVCDTEPDCLDGSDEFNDDCINRISNSSSVPVLVEAVAVSPLDKNQTLTTTLAYVDDLVAFYFDDFVSKSTTWPFALLGKAWTYEKTIDKPLQINFRLGVILHGTNGTPSFDTCRLFSNSDTDWGYPSFIECETISYMQFNWAVETQEGLSSLLSGCSEIIRRIRRPLWSVLSGYTNQCELALSDLIFYDMFIYLKGPNSSQLLKWKARKFASSYLDSNNEPMSNCFRDWYLPIYEIHGETKVLISFFRLMLSFLKHKSFTYGSLSINNGNFLHVWSEAAGTDLKYMYAKAIYWTSEMERELQEIKESYYLNYTSNSCHLAYIDRHVAVYFFSPGIYDTSTVIFVSDGWKFVKDNYGPFTNQSIHTIIKNYENVTLRDTSCTPLNNGIQTRNNFVTIINRIARESNVVSNWTMTSIVVYDIYLGLGLYFNANRWKEIQSTKTVSGIFWFRDWYPKIYETSNKLETLNSFLALLHTRGQTRRKGIEHGWNITFQDQFIQARKDFPSLNYSCTKCDHFRWKSYDQSTQPREKLLPIIIGVSVPMFVITLVVILAKFALYRRKIKKLNRTIRRLNAEELDEFLSGNLSENCNDVNAEILGVPFNSDFELSKDRLVVDQHRVLGSGEFGLVFHGILRGDQGNETPDMEVAVKTVKPNVEISYFKALLSEIRILTHLGLHENIVSLLGTRTGNIVNREVYMALELCPKGNLLHFLQRNSHQFQDSWIQSVFNEFQNIVKNESDNLLPFGSETLLTLSTQDLLEWSWQIANGMSYIRSKNVIHGDLAARNILLTFNNIAKISDFGLSRQLANYSVYQKTSKTPIPWKWLAIESLVDKTFSVHSDVWSFGITLWEIFSLGKVPYPGKCWDKNFVNNLIAGERLETPEHGNTDIYNIMLNCWKKIPQERISFQKILEVLSELTKKIPCEGGRNSSGRRQSCTYATL